MNAVEIKQELHQYIDSGDEKFLKLFYEMAKAYRDQIQKDSMISEGEEDIKAGRTHSLTEAKKIIDDWKIQ